MADDTLIALDHFVWLDINVAGVLARLKVYVVPVIQTYTILLSRRWLRRMAAVKHHSENKLIICGSDGKTREIQARKGKSVGTVMTATGTTVDGQIKNPVIDDEIASAMEIVLDELDNWIAGNA